MKHILVTTDFSKEAANAFVEARTQAAQLGEANVHLTLLHVIEQPASMFADDFGFGSVEPDSLLEEMEKEASKRLGDLKKEFPGIAISTAVIRSVGPASQAIVEFAQERQFDRIIMSTHGRTGLQHFMLGSVAEKVVRSAPCPVLVVPAAHMLGAV